MKLRSVNTSFWSDPFIEELTPSEKLIYLYLITNDKTNMLGIYEISIKKIAYETGINRETVLKALESFERVGKVRYVDNYVILTRYLKHQSFNTNMKKSAIEYYNALPQHLKIEGVTIDKSNPLKGFETLLNHYGILPKVEVEVEVEDEIEIEVEKETKHIPDLLEFETYAKEKASEIGIHLDEVKLKSKYFAWKENGWKTLGKSPRKIKNWKATLTNSLEFLKKEIIEQPTFHKNR